MILRKHNCTLRYVLFLILCFAGVGATAQHIYIPDPGFRFHLETEYPGCVIGDSLDSQCPEVVSDTTLWMYNQNIADLAGVEAFVNLVELTVQYGHLTEVPPLPSTLKVLNVQNNSITTVAPLPAGLKKLELSRNPITELPPLPPQLEELEFYDAEITEVIGLPNTIRRLMGGSNHLTYISAFPDSLRDVRVQSNDLTWIPELPSNPGMVVTITNNQLEYLPDLPEGLEHLICAENNLTSLPELPSTLIELNCVDNNLECLPVIPDSLSSMYISGNSISCIPNENTYILSANYGLPICTSNNEIYCDGRSVIEGYVYFDANNNCVKDQGEIGLGNRVVHSSNGNYALSQSDGYYRFSSDIGMVTVSQDNYTPFWNIDCPNVPYTVDVDTTSVYYSNNDFPNQATVDCHWLTVDIGSSRQRPCFDNNSYHVSYCNVGTEVAANAYIDVQFPSNIIPLSSSLPWTLGPAGNMYRFQLGDVAIDECGSFSVTDSVSCHTPIGKTVCASAEIFPTSPCLVPEQTWDQSQVSISAKCLGDTIAVVIRNDGSEDMSAPSLYRGFQYDTQVLYPTAFQLNAGDSIVVNWLADGGTYRFEAEQSQGYPGLSAPIVAVEGCGTPPYDYGQILPFRQDDLDDHIEVECIEVTASYDPNDKTAVPAGINAGHYIHPNDSIIDYKIRFQNTGNDTAFTVIVTDSLPTDLLNPLTFSSGSSSHPYTVEMRDDGLVTWHFEDIELPDSATNPVGSNGFVKFKIHTQPGIPLESRIDNWGAIYFDFNDPIITESCFLTIREDFLVSNFSSHENESPQPILYPNPSTGRFHIETEGTNEYHVLNSLGKLVKTHIANGNTTLDLSALPSGIYILQLHTSNGLVNRKLVKE